MATVRGRWHSSPEATRSALDALGLGLDLPGALLRCAGSQDEALDFAAQAHRGLSLSCDRKEFEEQVAALWAVASQARAIWLNRVALTPADEVFVMNEGGASPSSTAAKAPAA